MADTRIMLTCKHCGAGMCIGKGYDGSYYTVNKNMFHDLNAFYEVHEKGKCSDDADYSQDAKNHFVILEEGETLADVVPKREYDAVDNSTKEFLKLHDAYQEQKKEIERLQAKIKMLTEPEDFAERKKEIHGRED